MSTITINGSPINIYQYSDGSVSVTIPLELKNQNDLNIVANLTSPMLVLALYDILNYFDTFPANINLILNYLPNARQDRIQETDKGIKPDSFNTFVRHLSCYKEILKSVRIFDPHSILNISCLDVNDIPFEMVTIDKTIDYSLIDKPNCIIAPDKGAEIRASLVANILKVPYYIANKVRNPDTHEIQLEFNTDVNLENSSVLIVDDILDYGTSVHELTSILKQDFKVKYIHVHVTHAILPVNYRLSPPSRTSYALKYVDKFTCFNLFDIEGEIDKDIFSINMI